MTQYSNAQQTKANEVVISDKREVSCDGGELGHPKIYLKIKDKEIICPYCSKQFIYEP
jgi:uncharacterized Zn-finger protein